MFIILDYEAPSEDFKVAWVSEGYEICFWPNDYEAIVFSDLDTDPDYCDIPGNWICA